jgi:hypothetical protein
VKKARKKPGNIATDILPNSLRFFLNKKGPVPRPSSRKGDLARASTSPRAVPALLLTFLF